MKLSTIPGSPDERRLLAEQWNRHPGMVHAGARADFSDPEVVRIMIDPLEAHHRGAMGSPTANGAVLAGLFDVAIGIVGHCHSAGRAPGTVQLSIQFIRPLNGHSATIAARLVKAGKTLVFASAEAFDEHGVTCARADGIVAVAGISPAENQRSGAPKQDQ